MYTFCFVYTLHVYIHCHYTYVWTVCTHKWCACTLGITWTAGLHVYTNHGRTLGLHSQTVVANTHTGGHMQTWRSSSNIWGKYAHDKIMCTNKRPFTQTDRDGVHLWQLDVHMGEEESTGEHGGGQHWGVTLAIPHTCTAPDLTLVIVMWPLFLTDDSTVVLYGHNNWGNNIQNGYTDNIKYKKSIPW